MFNLKPQKPIYFSLFTKYGETIVRAAKTLEKTVKDFSLIEKNLAELKQFENEGDEIIAQILDQLNSALITPFDREDIFKLSNNLDDILDYIYGTVDKMVLYRVTGPTKYIIDMVDVVVEVSQKVYQSVSLLNRVSSNQAEILRLCQEINALESKGDAIFRASLQNLFDSTKDPMDFLRWKEIYEHLEHLIDLCEDIGDVLKGVVLKYA